MRQTSVLLITRRERKHHTTRKQYSCYNELQNKYDGTVWVLILTAALEPILHLWGYCTSNAVTTFDRQSIPEILEICSGAPLYIT